MKIFEIIMYWVIALIGVVMLPLIGLVFIPVALIATFLRIDAP